MPELLSIINCLRKCFPRNFATFLSIVEAMLCMSGPKNMLNISRWTNRCYKSIERFYERTIPWLELNWILIRNFAPSTQFLIASDETVVRKSGKKSHGLDYFFLSDVKRAVKSLCFSGLTLIHPQKKRSYPLLMSQLVFTPEEKACSKALKEHTKRSKGKPVGRPKGSKNQKKVKALAPTFRLLKAQLEQLAKLPFFSVSHFIGDGKYGNQSCVSVCREFGYNVISKLKCNSAFFFQYTGAYQGKGRPRIYGKQIDYQQMPQQYLAYQEETQQGMTRVYHFPELLNSSFDCLLNVVVIQRFTSNKMAQVILFSTDLGLSHQSILDYYSARFQIEFNFRDAKQFWGLDDFMNTKEQRIHNAANLAFFMVTLSTLVLEKFRIARKNSAMGIRDLIAFYRADRYYHETLKLLWKFNPDILIPHTNEEITSLGAIHG